MTEFKDFVVKLLVIDELMAKDIIEPPFADARDWVMSVRGIDAEAVETLLYEDLFAKRVPEIEAWARDLEITDEHLNAVENLIWDGGDDIFLLLAPSWDGEDDLYDVSDWSDVTPERFPNLKELIYLGDLSDDIRIPLEQAGVDIQEF